jgi:hypothetical protein
MQVRGRIFPAFSTAPVNPVGYSEKQCIFSSLMLMQVVSGGRMSGFHGSELPGHQDSNSA